MAVNGSASQLSCPESQQVSPLVDEARLAMRMEPVRERWRVRALDPGISESQRLYASQRYDALGRTHATRLDRCAKTGTVVKCACPGRRDVRWYGCRQSLTCTRCQRQRSKRLGARVRAALEARFAERPGSRLVLLTLTLRHSGNLQDDRDALALGWRKFYKAMHRRGWGKFAYVGVWEVTPGDDGLGHVHAHVAAVWPWLDWSEVAALWRQSCPESTRIDLTPSERPKNAAKYLSKYVSKGIQTNEFTPEMRADVLACMYNARSVFTSRRVWVEFHPVCGCCGTRVIRAQFCWSARPLDKQFIPWDGLDPPVRAAQASLAISDADEFTGGCRA